MPIQHSVWTLGDRLQQLPAGRLPSEQLLEEMIIRDHNILSSEWMIIGRQVLTSGGGRIDLLAITPDGSLVLIELKRERTPREVVAQALEYASWIDDLEAEEVSQIFQVFSSGDSLSRAFRERFGAALDEDTLNDSHQIVIVAAELDSSTERIINYLNKRDLAINILFFQVFEYGEERLLSRAWLIDPGETQVNAATSRRRKGEKEPWNGEYYVSFGGVNDRCWEDARKYGFISAGGGSWYSQTLKQLDPGDRIWVRIPGSGYVGVGRVVESVVPVGEFMVPTPEGDRPALDVLRFANKYREESDNAEKAEYFVRVRWIDTVSERDAVHDVGMFGNQNTVCQPVTPQWRHTVERLKAHFQHWDDDAKI